MEDLGNILLLSFGVLCVLPLLIAGVITLIVIRVGQQRFNDFISPDVEKMSAQLDVMRQREPDLSTDQMVRRMINRQAFKAGLVGAVTSFGGLAVLPIALPIDVALSIRLQAVLVNFISLSYGNYDASERGASIRNYLITTGSSQFTRTTTRFGTRMLVSIAGKSLAKFVPFLGALLGFVVNFATVQLIGRGAARWYSSHAKDSTGAYNT